MIWKILLIGFLALLVIYGCSMLLQYYPGIFFLLLVAVVVLAMFALWLRIRDRRKKKTAAAAPPPAKLQTTTLTSREDIEAVLEQQRIDRARKVPKSDDEKTGLYDFEYTGVGLFRPKDLTAPMPQVGEYVELALDPNNPYDSESVVAKDLGGGAVGYMNKGRLRNVIRRALTEHEPMNIIVSRADDRLEIYIAFNKPETGD